MDKKEHPLAMDVDKLLAKLDRMAKAEKIWKLLAENDAPSQEDNRSCDYCVLCWSDLPHGKTGEYATGAFCCPRHPDDFGRKDSVSVCGELRVPAMADRRGVIQDPAAHEAECPWRLAKELEAETAAAIAALGKGVER